MGEWEIRRKVGAQMQPYGISTRSKPELDRTMIPTQLDIVWAAAIYEGEGSCFHSQPRNASVQVSQKDRWLLDRLRAFYGGNVYTENRRTREHGVSDWRIHGSRAVEFLTEIYLYLSPRRQAQICKLYAWSSLLEAV